VPRVGEFLCSSSLEGVPLLHTWEHLHVLLRRAGAGLRLGLIKGTQGTGRGVAGAYPLQCLLPPRERNVAPGVSLDQLGGFAPFSYVLIICVSCALARATDVKCIRGRHPAPPERLVHMSSRRLWPCLWWTVC
jgi:hypothetical protein